jgi:hypothetical protein
MSELLIDFTPKADDVRVVRERGDCSLNEAYRALRYAQGDIELAIRTVYWEQRGGQGTVHGYEDDLRDTDMRRMLARIERIEAHLGINEPEES